MDTVEKDPLIRHSFVCRDYVDEAKYYQMSLASIVPEVNLTERSRPRKSYSGLLHLAKRP